MAMNKIDFEDNVTSVSASTFNEFQNNVETFGKEHISFVDEQTLTEEQKAQAKENLGIGDTQTSEVVLYDNADGEVGNVTLSESASNFKYMEIYYLKVEYPSNIYGSTRVYLPNGKRVPLHFGYPASDTVTQIITKIISINDTTITAGKETFLNFAQNTNTVGGVGTSTDCKIYRVVGYR